MKKVLMKSKYNKEPWGITLLLILLILRPMLPLGRTTTLPDIVVS